MHSSIVGPTLVLLAGLLAIPLPAHGEEPLFLRIRPNASAIGRAGDGAAEVEVAARARAAREAVWARSERRARIAIASVCTGCLKPIRPFAVASPAPTPTSPGAARTDTAAAPAHPTRSAALSPTIGDP